MPAHASERLPLLAPAALDPEQRRLYQAIVEGPRRGAGLADSDGRLRGPFNAMLYRPAIGGPLQELGAAIRHHGTLPDRMRELSILTIAARCRSGFEWSHHEPIARKLGWRSEQLRALREGREPEFDDPGERTTWQLLAQLLDTGDLDDEAYRRAVEHLGHAGLVELSTLVGYYRLLALQLRLFRVPAEP